MADADLLVAEREAVLVLREAEVGDEIEVEVVSDPVGGSIERSDGGGRAGRFVAGADANDVEQARRAAERRSMGAGARPMAQVARRDLRLGTSSMPALSAAASATPGVPVSASTTGDGLASR